MEASTGLPEALVLGTPLSNHLSNKEHDLGKCKASIPLSHVLRGQRYVLSWLVVHNPPVFGNHSPCELYLNQECGFNFNYKTFFGWTL